MTIKIIFDNGSELKVKCENCKLNMYQFDVRIASIEFEGVTENKPLYIDFSKVYSIYRVLNDEE